MNLQENWGRKFFLENCFINLIADVRQSDICFFYCSKYPSEKNKIKHERSMDFHRNGMKFIDKFLNKAYTNICDECRFFLQKNWWFFSKVNNFFLLFRIDLIFMRSKTYASSFSNSTIQLTSSYFFILLDISHL